MPDLTDQGRLGEGLERNVAALALPPLIPKGVIAKHKGYNKLTVNIRPKNWPDTKFWIGSIVDRVDAQFIADAAFYYLGQRPMFLTNATFSYPPLECAGATTPLTSREMCYSYATSIAKGQDKRHQRLEYRKTVSELVTELVKTVAVQTVLQQIRNGPAVNAHVPGFNLSESGFHLQSDLTLVEDHMWADSCLVDIEYSGADEGEGCSSTRVPEEDSIFYPSAFENFGANFFAMEDASED